MCEYLELYNLESYLFNTVKERFEENDSLTAFDFFCIIIWKANRAKSTIASNLKRNRRDQEGLDPIVQRLTRSLANAENDKERMCILIKNWGFRLPMASAILTVLWPNYFTVYDTRIRDELNFRDIQDRTNFDNLWNGYLEYKNEVINNTPENLSLRDKDRYLWAKSFKEQLINDIDTSFGDD